MALLTAATHQGAYAVAPDDLPRFIEAHAEREWVFYNTGIGFWVLHEALDGQTHLRQLLWHRVDTGSIHDIMLLDALTRLATWGECDMRSLHLITAYWAETSDIDENDEHRQRYEEMIGRDWAQINEGFFTCAAKDAAAIYCVYTKLLQQATSIAGDFAKVASPGCADRYGLLTETIAVKAAIALAQVTRNGMHCDSDRLAKMGKRLTAEIEALADELKGFYGASRLFRHKGGAYRPSGNRTLSINEDVLERLLLDVLRKNKSPEKPYVPRNKNGRLSTKFEYWEPYAAESGFIAKWIAFEHKKNLLAYTKLAGQEYIHPEYTPLVKTGRTACSNPPIQQIPKDGGLRECFTASPGHYLLAIDYNYIDLVTLAATCLFRFGKSNLAQAIQSGTDPHSLTASWLVGVPLDQFMALEETNRQLYAYNRQKSKALNFGIPAGMMADTLRNHARQDFKVDLTETEAKALRETIINQVFPELSRYLEDASLPSLAYNLDCETEDVYKAMGYSSCPPWLSTVVRRILSGNVRKRNGSYYSDDTVNRVWAGLHKCCSVPEIKIELQHRRSSNYLASLCDEYAVTLTGRVRAKATYTQARNTPFQGLAADGAKLACYDLLRAGYRLVGFIHDEFLIELPIDADHTAEACKIEQIVCGAMSGVIGDAVPVKAEYTLSTCWSKEAKCLFDEHGRLMPWSPADDEQG